MDKYEFMKTQWGFDRAPIHADGIDRPSDPYSRLASAREAELFERKFILGGIKGGLTYGYLWSLPHPSLPSEPTGTGYGKTSLMRETEHRINVDLGGLMGKTLGLGDSPPVLVAAYTCLDNEDTRGLYALLVSAVERWSDMRQCPGPDGRSILAAARARIVERLGCAEDDEKAIRDYVEETRRALPGGGTLPPLREEVISAFCSPDEEALTEELSQLTPAMRSRNGLAFFEAAFACLVAAGVEHVFLFLDQLEYMVTNRAVSKAQKSREIARFRTVFTQHPALASRCHVLFTLHNRASQNLLEFWEANRLPPFDPRSSETQNAVVVLHGLETADRIVDLVKPYFDAARAPQHPLRGSLTPIDPAILQRLWEASTARPGIILRRVASALDLAAEENRPVVDMAVLQRILDELGAPPLGEHATTNLDSLIE